MFIWSKFYVQKCFHINEKTQIFGNVGVGGSCNKKFFNLRGPHIRMSPPHTRHEMYFLLTLSDVTRKCTKNKGGKNTLSLPLSHVT